MHHLARITAHVFVRFHWTRFAAADASGMVNYKRTGGARAGGARAIAVTPRQIFALLFIVTALVALVTLRQTQIPRPPPVVAERKRAAAPVAATVPENRPDWLSAQKAAHATPPAWCASLVSRPRSLGACRRATMNSVLCSDGTSTFFGSDDQDMQTYTEHFRYLDRPGVFLDIAANEPVFYSNTYFYEQCLGWTGLCIEALPRYFDALARERKCALAKRCVSDSTFSTSFWSAEGLSGVVEGNKNNMDLNRPGFARERGLNVGKVNVNCSPTRNTLAPWGYTKIDLLSLDVEGHELRVLKGIDWNVTHISVIVVESDTPALSKFLAEKGFARRLNPNVAAGTGKMVVDSLYVHKSVSWGKPT